MKLSPATDEGPASAQQDALQGALRRLLAPIARLAVARGVAHATLEELLKQALVEAGDRAHPELLPHRRVSRIATATGIHRRDVSRLLQALREGRASAPPVAHSRSAELLAHWLSDPSFRHRSGVPRVLPRVLPRSSARQRGSAVAPSFEALAHAVTRDVHPRSLLDELLRLGMATFDAEHDTVALIDGAATPRADQARMLQFLGDNVGDHLDGAVDNVLADGRRHFEQALFAEGLTAAALAQVHRQVSAHWQRLLRTLVPRLEAMVERDRRRPDATHRLRLGLYTFEHAAQEGTEAGALPPKGKPP